MAAFKFDIKNLPPYAKVIIALLLPVVLSLVVIIFLVMPKQKEIKAIDAKLDEQNNQIAVSQAKVAKLDLLVKENEKLLASLNKLKEQLPEEKEISSLLKQVSDLALAAGLEMKSWRPGTRTTHPSGIVYETPVSVSVVGTFHDLGNFLGSLTKLNRIVNINNIQMGSPRLEKGSNTLQISFTASTFSAVPEAEAGKK